MRFVVLCTRVTFQTHIAAEFGQATCPPCVELDIVQALVAASRNGHHQVVRLLTDMPVNLNSRAVSALQSLEQ